MNLNTVAIGGRLTRNPELRFTAGGTAVCSFGIAQDEHRKDGEKVAHFFDVTAWGRTAESVAQYKRKGEVLVVEGRLSQSRWETQDGQKRSKVEVVAHRVHFGPREKAQQSDGAPDAGETEDGAPF